MSRWAGCGAAELSGCRGVLLCQLLPSRCMQRGKGTKRGRRLRGKGDNFKVMHHPYEFDEPTCRECCFAKHINRQNSMSGLRRCVYSYYCTPPGEDTVLFLATTTSLSVGTGTVMLQAQCPWQRCHANSNHVSCISTKQLSLSGGCSQQLTRNKHLSVLDAQ